MDDNYKQLLKRHRLRVTDNRIALLAIFDESSAALSAHDVESKLPDTDRVTLYRTLKSFQEKGIIHKAIDGTDTPRYAMCESECTEHNHHDEHVHFRCTTCHNTFCLNDVYVPKVQAPDGFQMQSSHMVVEGTCAQCS